MGRTVLAVMPCYKSAVDDLKKMCLDQTNPPPSLGGFTEVGDALQTKRLGEIR
jgi:hypothetical protein